MFLSRVQKMMFAALTLVLVGSVVGNEHWKSAELERTQAPAVTTATGEFDSNNTSGEYYGRQVVSAEVTAPTIDHHVLGVSDSEKRIEVDLTNQRLYAFEGDRKIYDFLISSGKWGRTPTGTFNIWGKFRYTKMSGGSKEKRTYYYLPNVPYVMYFSNDQIPASRGFGIHGTYWHSNFGHPMSHGCINMKTEEAGLIYEWSTPSIGEAKSGRATAENPGTKVVIYGTAPRE
jgi:lipoprotein-anchoring transpeptidase ErfK/SrfK